MNNTQKQKRQINSDKIINTKIFHNNETKYKFK